MPDPFALRIDVLTDFVRRVPLQSPLSLVLVPASRSPPPQESLHALPFSFPLDYLSGAR